MDYADYFYLTAYPDYSGYRIEHDPTITAYCHLTTSEAPTEDSGQNVTVTPVALPVVIAIIVLVAAVAVLVLRKR